jgi:hypothetical protein
MVAKNGKKHHGRVNGGTKSSRLNLLIQPELKKWAHGYAKKKGKSVSGLIMDHFIDLREREFVEDVQQI